VVLIVSKPVSPPFDDSGKVLPSVLVRFAKGIDFTVFTARGTTLALRNCKEVPLFKRSQSFRLPLLDKIKVLYYLLTQRPPPVAHFFFTPTRLTVCSIVLFKKRWRDVKVVHTITSIPDEIGVLKSTRADSVVVLSEYARTILSDVVPSSVRLEVIRPAVEVASPITLDEKRRIKVSFGLNPERPVVIYAGDLEFTMAPFVISDAIEMVLDRVQATFVFACREKTKKAQKVRKALEARLSPYLKRGIVRFFGGEPRFKELLACSHIQLFPVETTYAKSDIPLTLLEGLGMGVPAIVGLGTALEEIVELGGALGVPPLNTQALCETILRLLGDSALHSDLVAQGIRVVKEYYSPLKMAQAYEALYKELLGNGVAR